MSNKQQAFELIIKLEEQGDLDLLVKSGVISTSVLQHYKIAKRMRELRKRKRFTLAGELIRDVAFEFGVKKSTVYRATKVFS